MSCEKKLPKLKWKKLEAEMKQGYLDNEPAQAEIIRDWQTQRKNHHARHKLYA